MLAYYEQWHMRQAWKPLLFTDERTLEKKLNRDPVVPAKRSAATLAKVHSRKLADGTLAMSFAGLLEHIATIVRNCAQRLHIPARRPSR